MGAQAVELSKVHRFFYPQVPVVITAEFEGKVAGMPAIWSMPLSFNPSMVGVAISPEHETRRIILGAQAFAMNWLDFAHASKVGELGETSAKEQLDKLSAVGFTTAKGTKTGQPLITEASASIECALRERKRTGSHELMIGEVVSASADYFDDYWNFIKYNPLLYAGTASQEKSWVFKSWQGQTATISLKHQK